VALCPGGAFADNVVANPSHVLVVKSVYTCDDGSGAFNAITELRSTPGPDDSVTTTGTVQLLGGTGAFTNLIGFKRVAGICRGGMAHSYAPPVGSWLWTWAAVGTSRAVTTGRRLR